MHKQVEQSDVSLSPSYLFKKKNTRKYWRKFSLMQDGGLSFNTLTSRQLRHMCMEKDVGILGERLCSEMWMVELSP